MCILAILVVINEIIALIAYLSITDMKEYELVKSDPTILKLALITWIPPMGIIFTITLLMTWIRHVIKKVTVALSKMEG